MAKCKALMASKRLMCLIMSIIIWMAYSYLLTNSIKWMAHFSGRGAWAEPPALTAAQSSWWCQSCMSINSTVNNECTTDWKKLRAWSVRRLCNDDRPAQNRALLYGMSPVHSKMIQIRNCPFLNGFNLRHLLQSPSTLPTSPYARCCTTSGN